MYEPTCDLCLYRSQCRRAVPCSHFTPEDEEVIDYEIVERGRDSFYEEWNQYIREED